MTDRTFIVREGGHGTDGPGSILVYQIAGGIEIVATEMHNGDVSVTLTLAQARELALSILGALPPNAPDTAV